MVAGRVCGQAWPSSPPGEADKLATGREKKFRHHITNSEQKKTLVFCNSVSSVGKNRDSDQENQHLTGSDGKKGRLGESGLF